MDYKKPHTAIYAVIFDAVKKAYMAEMLFVDEFERERLSKMEKQKKPVRRYGQGW